MQQLDPRLVKITVDINGKLNTFEDIAITASGTKYANPLQNEAEVTLTNLDKQTQDYILTQTTPFNINSSQKTVTIYAGRQSYGTTKIYSGNIVSSSVSQPPDIALTLKCLTGNFLKNVVLSTNQGGTAPLSQISRQIAQDGNLLLNFQAPDKTISNYFFSGSTLGQINALATMGGLNVFVDDNTLAVKGFNVPLTGITRVLDASSGMIGIPEFTEQGIKVKFLIDNITKIGGALQIRSSVYPAVNGTYVIYKLGFEIANRDTPFYYIAEAVRRF